MSVPNPAPPEIDPKKVRAAARAFLRAAGYNVHTVTYLSAYPDLIRVHTIGADGRITRHVHKLPGGNMSWTEG